MKLNFVKLLVIPISFVTLMVPFNNCSRGYIKSQGLVGGQLDLSSTLPQAPEISFSPAVPELINSASLSISFLVKPASQDQLKSVQCQLDDQGLQLCSDSTVVYNNLSDGDHTVKITASTTSGGTGVQTKVFRKDSRAPVLTVSQTPPSITSAATSSFIFSATDNLSGVKQIECSLDSQVYAVCMSPHDLLNLSMGSHTLKLKATDMANNVSAVYSYTWTVDASVPTVTIATMPNQATNSTAAQLTFSGSGIVSYECQLDGGIFSACTSPKSYTGLTAGSHIFAIRGQNSAGTLSSLVTYSWLVDLNPPSQPTVVTNVTSPTALKSASFNFSSTDSESGISDFQCSKDNGSFVSCLSPLNWVNLADGSRSLKVRVTDKAGNLSSESAFNWLVDSIAPVISFTVKPISSTSTSADFQYAISESGSGLKLNQCALDSAAFTNCSGSVTLTGLSATDHIFRVQAQDQAGNLAVVQHNWTVSAVTPPPEPPPQPPPTGDTGMVTLGAVVTEGGGKYSIPVTFKNAASVQLSASHVNFSVLGTAICDKAVEVSGLVSAKVILTNCRNSGTLRIRLDAGTATSSTGEVAAAVGPSADILINASIKNPYYTATAWKVWGLDASPVNLTSGTVSSLALGSRNVPDFTSWSNPSKIDDNYTLFKLGGTDAAGSWDDGYASLDALHSNLGSAGWSDDYNHQVNLGAQYITTKTITVAAADIPKVGINFTSMSYANQGHQRACGNLYYEQSQYFRNTIDAAPGYLSYRETSSDRAIDQYDGLFSHYFNSVGRSSSEIGAIGKMMATAAFIPQATKNLLKKNGAYASAISMLFRSTLPYIDSSGAEVEFENELLHRPAYYSNGAEFSLEFHKFNLYYHRYDESQHFYRMAKMARSMDVAPPISIVQILGLSVMDAAGTTLVSNSTNDVRIKSQLKTSVRIWAEQNETLDLRLDVGSSYDLQGLPLTYSVTAVYPEHSLVKITREGTSSVYRIQVKYDPKFPKGRIPVVITANNGKFKSNPAFVNFYFKEPGQTYCLSSYFNISPTLSVEEVNRNLRPALTTSLPKDELVIQPGQTATFDIYCNDPEGFPTRIYRWSGERGVIAGNKFTLATSATDGNAVFPQHLICSDGTGGYNSRLVHVIVKKETDIIPSGWIMGPIGSPQIPAFAQVAGDTFDITGGGVDFGYASHRGNLDSGNMLYTNVTGNVDFAAQVLDIRSPGQNANLNLKAGVMIRWNSMDNSSRIFSTIQGNMNSGSNLNYVAGSRRDEGSWEAQSNDGGFPPTTNFFVRVVRIDNEFAAFRSVDGIHWQTQISEPWGYGYAGARPESVQVGFAISAGDPKGLNDWVTQAKMKRLPAAAVSIPIIKLAASRKDWVTNPALYSAPATLTAIAPSGGAAVVRYTKDGSDPTAASEILTSPMSLSTGQYLNLKFRAFDGSQQSDVVIIEAFQVQ